MNSKYQGYSTALLSNKTACFLLCIISLFPMSSYSQKQPDPRFHSTQPEKKQFVMEYVYNYTRSRYAPPITIQQVARTAERDSIPANSGLTPEDMFTAFISAMRAGDYEWWLSSWTSQSQDSIKEKNRQTNRSADDWIASWHAALDGKQVILLERLETGPYVILVYSLRASTPQAEEILRSLYVAKNEGGRWLATQELEKDPFLFHYLEEKDKSTIIVR